MKFIKQIYEFRKIMACYLSFVNAKIIKVMNNSTRKSIKRLSIVTIIIGGLALAITYWEIIAQLWISSYYNPITWNPDIKGWQIFIISARLAGLTLLFILCCVFLSRTNKGLENGEIFPESNISLIRWSAAVAAFLAFVNSNFDSAVKGESVLTLDSNFFLIPIIILLFAGLYKMAYLAAKDSNLAI